LSSTAFVDEPDFVTFICNERSDSELRAVSSLAVILDTNGYTQGAFSYTAEEQLALGQTLLNRIAPKCGDRSAAR